MYAEFARRALIANSFLGAIQRFFSAGATLQLVAVAMFSLGGLEYALFASALSLSSLFQLLGVYSNYRIGPFRTLLLSYRLRTVLLLIAAFSPMLYSVHAKAGVITFFLCAFLINVCHAFGFNVCWPAIVRAGTKVETRGAVTSRLRATQSAIAAVIVLLVAIVGPEGFSTWLFMSVVIVFCCYSLVAELQVRSISRLIPMESLGDQANAVSKMISDCRTLAADVDYKKYLLLVVMLGACAFPLQIYFFRDVLRVADSVLFWYVTALTWAGILSMRFWGLWIDRIGHEKAASLVSVINVLAFSAIAMLLLQIDAAASVAAELQVAIFTAVFLTVIAGQGAALLWFYGALKLLPPQLTTVGVLFLSIGFELSAAVLAALVGGMRGTTVLPTSVLESVIAAALAVLAALTWMRSRAAVLPVGSARDHPA